MNEIILKDIQALIIEAADGAFTEVDLSQVGHQFKHFGM